jgi:uncharacterized BrkB/YihY/UPF0761 family membrane protein
MNSTPQFDELKKNHNAQMTVVGLLLIFLTIMVLSVLMPSIITAVGTMAGNLTTGGYISEAIMVKFVPLFIIVTLLSTIALYGAPQL